MTKRKLLIADDEPEIAELLAEALSEFGDCVVAFDGIEAYRKAREQEFDLICTDFRMPKLDGAKLVASLRESLLNQKTPILVISGYMEEARLECGLRGVEKELSFVQKPFKVDDVRAAARKALLLDAPAAPLPVPPPPFRFDTELVNPFLEAVAYTLKTLGQIPKVAPLGTSLLKREEEPLADISGTVTFAAQEFTGSFSLSFPEATFVALVSNMLGKKFEKITPEIEESALELASVAFGAARSSLSKKETRLQKVITGITSGKGHFLRAERRLHTFVARFESSAGQFFVVLTFCPGGTG